jgi:osmotically-inducible protein OsmY
MASVGMPRRLAIAVRHFHRDKTRHVAAPGPRGAAIARGRERSGPSVVCRGPQFTRPNSSGAVSNPIIPMKTSLRIALLLGVMLPAVSFAASATDRKIEDAAKASYNYRTVLEDHVKIKASDGVVTLTGTVMDEDDRDLAEDTVENLPGVVRVDNQIVIKSTVPEHSDAWIALKIRSRLLVKAHVSFATTKVDVKDGVVTLTGTAENAAQKDLTEAYVKDIDHVKSVRNELVVQAPPAGGNTMSDAIDDASITSQVKYELLRHRSTSALKTKVVTNDGVVTITGEAASDAEKSLVSKLAADIRGVKSVDNNMTVKG